MKGVPVEILEAYQSVVDSAEAIRNDEHASVEVFSTGDVLRQGDLYLTCLGAAPTRAGKYTGRQLAPGTTQGSRHVVVGDCELYTPDESDAVAKLNQVVPATKGHRQFTGPVIVAKSPVTIEHPEHGDRTIPSGVYLVTFQKVWANEIRRTQD